MTVRTQYEADLTALKAALVEMGQNSADAVEAALEALCTADAAAAAASSRAMAESTTWSGTSSIAA